MTTYNQDVAVASGGSTSTPLWLLVIRVVQAVFNILVLCLTAYAASFFYLDGYGMAFFTFVWTILFLLYIFLAPRVLPQLYLFWAHVGFEATVVIFWLVTFALLADYTRGFDYYWGRRGNGPIGATKAAMAFALFNWLLFSVTLAVTVWLSRSNTGNRNSAVVDGTTHSHTHSTTSPATTGFSFSNLFGRNKGAADVEKTGAPHNVAVNETGQSVEMHNQGPAVGGGAQYGNVQEPVQTYQQPTQAGYDQNYQPPR